jgi:hypothetical protein
MEDPNLHELPPILIDGIPTPVEKMTQVSAQPLSRHPSDSLLKYPFWSQILKCGYWNLQFLWIGIVVMLNFHFDADPDPDPGWHQNDADPHANPTPIFTYLIDKNSNLQCFSFLLSGKGVNVVKYFGQHIEFSGEKKSKIRVLGTDADPDPAK